MSVDYPEPVSKLLTLGDARGEWQDYLALGLSQEDVPDLIRMALDEELYFRDSEDVEVWAPIHAWRALAQLRAEEAVQPLTRLLSRIDNHPGNWVGEELPVVFAMIGPGAIPVLASYLDDDEHGLFARAAAAHGLVEIGQRHPEARSACVEALSATLERYQELDPTLNALIISYLMDLDAVEVAPLMERAFAANVVDLSMQGDWEEVQIELGLLDRRRTPKLKFGWLMPGVAGTPEQAAYRLDEFGRNERCWCGSGKKYKHCHLREDQRTARG
jgi:hypothetical protein